MILSLYGSELYYIIQGIITENSSETRNKELIDSVNHQKQINEKIIMKQEYEKSISIRLDKNMAQMIDELQQMLPLNVSSIMRLALVTFHKEQQNGDDE